ncbi:MAG: endolytic transglycosylase MltG [Sarcina sp.]
MNKGLKSKLIVTIVLIVAIIIAIIGVFTFKYTENKKDPFNTTNKVLDINVQKGEYLYTVLDQLEAKGIIKNAFLTKMYLKLNPSETDIKPGDYEIPGNISLDGFVNMLVKGEVATYKVTFPEGFTIEQMADRLQSEGIMKASVFIDAVKNYPLPSYIKPNSERRYNLEGFLYPDTYNIPKSATADDIISMMLNQFQKQMDEAQKITGVKVAPADYEKIVTIASMIEGEASTQHDRDLVSSVIYNRLKIGMPLQLDATVLYAMGEHKSVVYNNYLKIDSPYNTYKVPGLPIGPINNPGIECLEAAMKPAQSDYLYYVLSPGSDQHFFTNNYSEFEKAAAKYTEYINKQPKQN